jgi:hypothetical protein
MEQFKVGQTYKNAFGDDHEIISRTAKTVVVKCYHAGSTMRKKIIVENGVEKLDWGIGSIWANK